MQSWLQGSNWVGKGAYSTGSIAHAILSSKADSNTWESFARSGLKPESVHQESLCSDVFRKMATMPLLKQKQRPKHLKKNWTVAQWSKVLFSDKSKFCIKFGNQVLETGEAHNPSSLKSSVKFSKSVMIWGAVTSADVGPLCFLKSKVYQEILEHVMLPSADKLYGDSDLFFQQDLSTCPHCQNHFQVVCWPWYYCAWLASQHAWPEPHMESMEYFQVQDEKQSIQ